MSSTRRTAVAAGLLYLVTHVASVAALALYGSELHGGDRRILAGALVELVLAVAVTGTAAVLYPVVKRYGSASAIGYAGLRALEGATMLAGITALIALVSLRRPSAGTDPATLAAVEHALVAVHDWTFLIGPGLICGIDTVILARLLYRSRLVPRFIPVVGLIGGPLVFASDVAMMFGAYGQTSPVAALGAVPVFAWEVSLAVYLIVKGFRSEPATPADVEVRELETVG